MPRHRLPLMLALFSLPGFAGDAALNRCAALADAQARLACYDALARSAHVAPDTDPGPAPAASVPAADPSDRFGAEDLPPSRSPAENGPDRIESRLTGPLNGWKKGTLFELENGQVWRCIDDREVYWVADRPKVTIRRGFMGNYWLKVEGLNTQARVRRIR
ncbi:hypothetical protein SAMN04488120_11819 [Fontimonas thermophila]|uniref:Uncharacterized protein n=1 Tax=Fontimonas thermophila TaxID=1076937 RepID=A0A1I2KGZ3_9GAMM|nr:hypothetical protein [Fontimonas thermophila]SFF65628.1 hypothetical protein SAMN04488120_11819 [Fontimonas thermophila]